VGLLDSLSLSVSEFEYASKLATVSDDVKLGEVEVWLQMQDCSNARLPRRLQPLKSIVV
jgi:hypothetical protein